MVYSCCMAQCETLSTAYIIMSQINSKLHIMEVLGLPHYSHVHLKLLRELLLGCSQYSLSDFCLSTCLHFSQNLSWQASSYCHNPNTNSLTLASVDCVDWGILPCAGWPKSIAEASIRVSAPCDMWPAQ